MCVFYSNRGIRSTNETASAAIVDFQPAVITGLRVEEVDKGVSYEDGVSIVLAGATVSIILWLTLVYCSAELVNFLSASLIKQIIQVNFVVLVMIQSLHYSCIIICFLMGATWNGLSLLIFN